MVNQYRHGIEQVGLELPGGLVDPQDASPEVAARRELLEETGYQAAGLIKIGECYPQPAVLSNRCFFFCTIRSRTRLSIRPTGRVRGWAITMAS